MSKLSLAVEKVTAEPAAIVALEDAIRIIEVARETGDIPMLRGVRDAAIRWEYQRRRRKDSRQLADDAGEIKVRAEHALALWDVEIAPRGLNEEFRSTETPAPLEDLHVETRAEIRKLAQLKPQRLTDLITAARADELRGVTTGHLVALMSGHMGGTKASTSNEWYTPADYITAARDVMGGIDLDPASSSIANETVKADRIFTIGDDGLSQEWSGRIWLNPPYGKGSGLFTSKLVEEYRAGRVAQAVLLLNAYGFDSDWFQPLWEFPICFTDHRITFWSPQRRSGGPANGNTFTYLGPNDRRFAEVFDQFGTVVRAWP